MTCMSPPILHEEPRILSGYQIWTCHVILYTWSSLYSRKTSLIHLSQPTRHFRSRSKIYRPRCTPGRSFWFNRNIFSNLHLSIPLNTLYSLHCNKKHRSESDLRIRGPLLLERIYLSHSLIVRSPSYVYQYGRHLSSKVGPISVINCQLLSKLVNWTLAKGYLLQSQIFFPFFQKYRSENEYVKCLC